MSFINELGLSPNDRVALEGAPIYLADEPMALHERAFLIIKNLAAELIDNKIAFTHYVLLDEYNCAERPDSRRKYLEYAGNLPMIVNLESEMAAPAKMTLNKKLKNASFARGGKVGNFLRLAAGTQPVLMKDSGAPACSLLDASFQLQKKCDLNIIVHPEYMTVTGNIVDFRKQQADVQSVLTALRDDGLCYPRLPWSKGLLHLWLSRSGKIVEANLIYNKGRGVTGRKIDLKYFSFDSTLCSLPATASRISDVASDPVFLRFNAFSAT